MRINFKKIQYLLISSRPKHSIKNLLIFLPILASNNLSNVYLIDIFFAFFFLILITSATYILKIYSPTFRPVTSVCREYGLTILVSLVGPLSWIQRERISPPSLSWARAVSFVLFVGKSIFWSSPASTLGGWFTWTLTESWLLEASLSITWRLKT